MDKDSTHFLRTTSKVQRYKIFFIFVNALHVSGGFSTHHQDLKNSKHSICYVPGLLAATASYCSWAPDDWWKNRPKHVEHWQK